MSSSMCRATLLPEPDSPLTMIRRIDMGAAAASGRQARLDHLDRMVIAGLFLVLLDTAVELVRQSVDGGVHVGFGGIGVNFIPPQHERGFRLVAEFFHGEHAMNVDQLLEMP